LEEDDEDCDLAGEGFELSRVWDKLWCGLAIAGFQMMKINDEKNREWEFYRVRDLTHAKKKKTSVAWLFSFADL